jgi:hypothetical protein
MGGTLALVGHPVNARVGQKQTRRFQRVGEADEGTRTLDLLHGKDLARGDWK